MRSAEMAALVIEALDPRNVPDDRVQEQVERLRAIEKAKRILAQEVAGPEGPASWEPVDLSLVLGEVLSIPEPAIGLARTDGLRLLYAGREHAVIGEMESGKSWFAAGSSADVLSSKAHVLYFHYEEADPTGTVEKLRALGIDRSVIADFFHFVAPVAGVDRDKLDALAALGPILVIHDGVNEAMALHGWDTNAADGAAEFRRQLTRPFTDMGAAVLSCDHVTKSADGRGRYAMGSIHKGNGLSGSLILLENREPFGRGRRGKSKVYVTKDRPGALRASGRAAGLAGRTHMGDLVVDDSRERVPYLDLTFFPPYDDEGQDGGTGFTGLAAQVLDLLRANPGGLEVTQIVAHLDQAESKDHDPSYVRRLLTQNLKGVVESVSGGKGKPKAWFLSTSTTTEGGCVEGVDSTALCTTP